MLYANFNSRGLDEDDSPGLKGGGGYAATAAIMPPWAPNHEKLAPPPTSLLARHYSTWHLLFSSSVCRPQDEYDTTYTMAPLELCDAGLVCGLDLSRLRQQQGTYQCVSGVPSLKHYLM